MSKLEVISFNKQIFHAVSLSGGKDSTAMLLLMIERGLPINTVLWADTGMEFPEMYDHIRKVDDYLYRERGIHITMLRHPKGFEYLMFEEEKQKPSSIENRQRLGVPLYGNGWPGVKVRWCTGQLKTHLISKEVNRLKGEYQALHYYEVAGAEPHSVIVLKQPFGDIPAGKKLLWVCGDRGFHCAAGVFGGELKCSGRLRVIPVEAVLNGTDDPRMEGLDFDSPAPSENAYMKRYSVANYAHRMRAGLAR